MDELIAKLLAEGSKDTIAALDRLTAAITRQSELTERVVAGQEAAMAKLEGGATTTRKPRQTAAEKAAEAAATVKTAETAPATTPSTSTPAAGEQPVAAPPHALLTAPNGETVMVKNAKTGADEATPTANYRASDFSRDQVKNEFIGWLGDTTDPEERKRRGAFVGEIAQHFGITKPFDPTNGLVDDEQRKQTLFFLRRKREGLAVNFGADYDFDGDPLADQTVDAVEADEPDPLG